MTEKYRKMLPIDKKIQLLVKRLIAALFDLALVAFGVGCGYVVLVITSLLAAGLSLGRTPPVWLATPLDVAFDIANPVLFIAFVFILAQQELRTGQTPGKRALRLTLSSLRPGIIRYTLRHATKYLPITFPVLMTYILPWIGLEDDAFGHGPGYNLASFIMGAGIGLTFLWLATFVLSARGQFPHDFLFGTNVRESSDTKTLHTASPGV